MAILSCTLEGSIPFENVFFVVAKTLSIFQALGLNAVHMSFPSVVYI